jgi:hypothetical protein
MQHIKTFTVGSCTVVVHRPELTEEARRRREAEVSRALTRYALHTTQREKGGQHRET